MGNVICGTGSTEKKQLKGLFCNVAQNKAQFFVDCADRERNRVPFFGTCSIPLFRTCSVPETLDILRFYSFMEQQNRYFNKKS